MAEGRLAGKRAIVTGAASGIGAGYAEALAREGCALALCDIDERVRERQAALAGTASQRVAFVGDVADPQTARKVVDATVEAFGGIDILINNAGVWGESEASDNLDKTVTDYDRIVRTNFHGEFYFGRAVMPVMIQQGTGGDIVNVATDHMFTCGTPHDVCPNLPTCPWNDTPPGFDGPPRPTGGGPAMDLYDAAKWALNGLLYAWAQALAPHGIRVNGLCMGATDSAMLRGFHGDKPPPEEVARWMRVEDAAQALIDLLCEGPDGRTACNMNFCIGRPVRLEPPLPPLYIKPPQVALP